ncbi:tubulin--tyrosine ligase-like protein 12 isoform X2 [Cinnamomum micranthum f. kanehirae]|uniref:Tubulin--tyrosine ligase-like protein 12 isoform X2 n=1 Tax=Cinnamomum micranthum f. kanehirae TaxID=337451 RepID=A0A443N9L8_9MAGN|nr:tubulin--tyrosine ligase-like protein 12 isoform X2 [Cinnamomum micranthum f. kanehirae]
MSSTVIRDLDDFVNVHGLLLASSGIPPSLYNQLFLKLSSETFDGGDFFQIEPCEDGRQRRLVLSSDSMEKESHLFLVDHAWTFRLSDARKQLQQVPGLAQRMAALMCVDLDLSSDSKVAVDESSGKHENAGKGNAMQVVERVMHKAQEEGYGASTWLELDELDIDDDMLISLDLSSKFPNLVALNLWGNKLQNAEVVVREITRNINLRAVWLNENPVIQNCGKGIADAIFLAVPGLEIYNSCFTSNFGEWALGFCGGLYGEDNPCSTQHNSYPLKDITDLNLSNRCIHNLSNKAFYPINMPSLSYLNLRGNPLDRDSVDDLLKVLRGFTCLQALEVDIPGPLGESAVKILESLPNLSLLNGVRASQILESNKHVIDSMLQPRLPEWIAGEPLAELVISAMWLYLMTYRLADEEKIDETSVWYVMDELGSALRHSDKPNFRIAPFLFLPERKLASAVSFSVLWPTRNVQKGGECTRDFLFGIGEDKQRSARLTAWFHTPQNYFIKAYERYCQQLHPIVFRSPPSTEPSRIQSILPCGGHPLRLHTDIPHVEEFLTRSEFTFTPNPTDADIIWTSVQVDEEVKRAIGLKDHQYINQFPFEACLVMKHHLAETVHMAKGSAEWLQPTYNLETHLSELIGDYFVRKRDGLNNLWILKPWNMARTIDTTVTDDLSAVIRLMETGPKICQKYIEHPALFQGKKFDLRYIVLVRSMNPLEIFLSDVFWARLANNPYTLDKSSLLEYETHFTVMNYVGRLNHMNTSEFVMEFEREHQVKWLDIHQRVRTMIRDVFESAASVHPEMQSPLSRAMYGVDVMLDCSFQPKLLEVTYCPDCTRACKYDTRAVVGSGDVIKGKDFFNMVFGCLFLNELAHVTPL